MVEYLILVAVVIAVLLIFLGQGGYFQGALNGVIQQQGDDMLNAATTMFK